MKLTAGEGQWPTKEDVLVFYLRNVAESSHWQQRRPSLKTSSGMAPGLRGGDNITDTVVMEMAVSHTKWLGFSTFMERTTLLLKHNKFHNSLCSCLLLCTCYSALCKMSIENVEWKSRLM